MIYTYLFETIIWTLSGSLWCSYWHASHLLLLVVSCSSS